MCFLFKEEHIVTFMVTWKTGKICFCQETVILLLKQNMAWRIKYFFATHKTSAKFKSFKLNTYRYFHICKYSCFGQICIFSAEKTSSSLYSIHAKAMSASLFPVTPTSYSDVSKMSCWGVFLSIPSSVVLVTQCSNTAMNTGRFTLHLFVWLDFCLWALFCSKDLGCHLW